MFCSIVCIEECYPNVSVTRITIIFLEKIFSVCEHLEKLECYTRIQYVLDNNEQHGDVANQRSYNDGMHVRNREVNSMLFRYALNSKYARCTFMRFL